MQPWLQIFAPLARLLGLYSIKQELEELSFMYSQPKAYAAMRSHLDEVAKQQEPVVIEVGAIQAQASVLACWVGAMAFHGVPHCLARRTGGDQAAAALGAEVSDLLEAFSVLLEVFVSCQRCSNTRMGRCTGTPHQPMSHRLLAFLVGLHCAARLMG